jgi:flavin-binding protein dodecin
MHSNVYKKIEIIGTSSSTMEDAILNAIGRASETVRNMRWFEVIETRGSIENGSVAEWQVTIKIGFTLDKG